MSETQARDPQDVIVELMKLEKWLVKNGRQELTQELRGLDNDDLRQRLMKQAVLAQEIMDTKDKASKKADIVQAKNTLREHNAMYREQTTWNNKISRFIHLLIEDSGKI